MLMSSFLDMCSFAMRKKLHLTTSLVMIMVNIVTLTVTSLEGSDNKAEGQDGLQQTTVH